MLQSSRAWCSTHLIWHEQCSQMLGCFCCARQCVYRMSTVHKAFVCIDYAGCALNVSCTTRNTDFLFITDWVVRRQYNTTGVVSLQCLLV
jgi:hypothetical protein